MSQLSARSEIFLAEIGVGPQWKLRNPPPAQAPLEADAASEPVSQPAAVVAAPVPAPVPMPVPMPVPVRVPVRVPVPVSVSVSVSAPIPAPMPVPAPLPAPAPAAAPAPVSAPAPQPAALGDDVPPMVEDTAWFDDAPMPDDLPASAPVAARAPRGPVSEEAIAEMDWDELEAAITSCTRCTLCATRQQAVPGRGARKARWITITLAPSAADEASAQVISGEAGQLLDNMLKAVSLSTEENARVTTLVKCRPQTDDGADRLPTAEEVMACRPFLEREVVLSGVSLALTMGQGAAKGLLGVAARGKVHHYDGLPVVATYHPEDLLRKPQDKAKAWADLCLARDVRD